MPKPSKNYPRSKVLSGLPTSSQLFTVAEVAIILGVSIEFVHVWINNKLLPSFQLGKETHFTRVRAQDLENFIDTQIRSGKVSLT